MLSIDVEANVGRLRLRAELPAYSGTTILVGPNGAGKTTLLKSILGVVNPSHGRVVLGDSPMYCAEQKIDVPTEHRRLGYLPQKYALFSNMTVHDNVAFGISGMARSERKQRVEKLLQDLEISHLGKRRTSSLSGGESQRVALARALAIGPRALLLDEPMAALDAGVRRKVRQFLATRLRSIGIPTIVVSHDIDDVEMLGGRIAVLEAGRVVQLGSIDELRKNPQSEFVEEFLGTPGAPVRAKASNVVELRSLN